MGFWANLFGRSAKTEEPPETDEERFEQTMTFDQYLENFLNFQANMTGYGGSSNNSGRQDREGISATYAGYGSHAYKANGPIFAVCAKRMMVFSEARFGFQVFENHRPADPVWHPSLKVLENPWPGGRSGDLFAKAIQDVDL